MLGFVLRGLGLALLAFMIGPARIKQARVIWDRFWTVSAALVVLILTISILIYVVRVFLDHVG